MNNKTSNQMLRGRWKIWRNRFQKVKGVSVVHRASDVGLELHTIGMTDEVAREELCVELMERLNSTRPADEIERLRAALVILDRQKHKPECKPGGCVCGWWDAHLLAGEIALDRQPVETKDPQNDKSPAKGSEALEDSQEGE